MMSSQNNADDSMNFSVIDRNEEHQGNVDFSVRSLLENNESVQKIQQSPVELPPTRHQVFNKIKEIRSNDNKTISISVVERKAESSQNFLKDLSRMEKELSFQAQSYNIYNENHNNSTQIIHNNKSKTLSYLRVTKEYTNKSISKQSYQDFNDYYGELIIDFHKKDNKMKEKVISKADSRNASKNLSCERSNTSKSNARKERSSRKQIKTFFRFKQKNPAAKSKPAENDFRKSKSKSLTHKIKQSKSKTCSNLKTSTQAETLEEKVFTQYYGTQINFKPRKYDTKKKKETLAGVKSKEKSSKSKLGVLSPRGRQVNKANSKK